MQESPPDAHALIGDPRCEPRLDRDGRVFAYTCAVDSRGWLYIPGLAYYRFSTEGKRVEALPDQHVSVDTVTEAFYRVALPMALQAAGYEVLHASAVSDARGVHVFCGASHSGKSTIAYGLSSRGFELWADDAVVFSAQDGPATAIPLPFVLRLRGEVAEFFDVPSSAESDTKTEVLRHQARGALEIASVSLLEPGSSTAITRLSGPAALPAVLYHSFYFSLEDPLVRRRMSAQFLELIARVPVFRVSLRPGLNGIADLVDELEQRVVGSKAL